MQLYTNDADIHCQYIKLEHETKKVSSFQQAHHPLILKKQTTVFQCATVFFKISKEA